MQTYILTLWLLWTDSSTEIVQQVTTTLAMCQALAYYHGLTIAADGVVMWSWSCVSQWGV